MPGTILEIDPADAKELSTDEITVASGSVVRIECDQVHLGGKDTSFSAVVILQPGTLPRGVAFAYFSYPVSTAQSDAFPYRDFNGDGYVNDISTGWCDPINPIAAVKFARGKIVPTGKRVPLAGESLPEGVVRGLSPAPRNIALIPVQSPRVANEGADRLRWKFRGIIVQKGLPKAPLSRHAGKVGDPPHALPDLFRAPDCFLGRLEVDAVLRREFLDALDGMVWSARDYWPDWAPRQFDGWTDVEKATARAWLRSL